MNGRLRNRRRLRIEEVDPLQGVINIVDAMLVFACGLMLSLIMHWNVDLDQPKEHINLNKGKDVTQNQNIRRDLKESKQKGKLYKKMGSVYKDPATGKLFMISDK
ncbi:hypothetical protein CLRAG_34050 [Clostridium ragsdalei P11]|uniref:DUF2149 domain-containing protein n=1 Tax=Clostridium ragsdalei P11 TaxID=1353534 RepID=A0A1A6AKZ4_9CLOT|nr:DUF2149 domain-containing protein [Clostridium ragsdalei]OBR90757.1 hypothetical protein CLRAG_34050 [Clostridium ragsdalei P11]